MAVPKHRKLSHLKRKEKKNSIIRTDIFLDQGAKLTHKTIIVFLAPDPLPGSLVRAVQTQLQKERVCIRRLPSSLYFLHLTLVF